MQNQTQYLAPLFRMIEPLKARLPVGLMVWLCTVLCMQNGVSQISIGSLPFNPAVTDFNAYNPNSAMNLAATIPEGWTAASGGTQVYNGQGTGTSTTGGYWAYGTGGEYSLGALRSGTPLNITYAVNFVNNTGTTITSITLSWDYEQWRYANTSGWNCSGTGALAGNATLNAMDFVGTATGTSGTVTVTAVPAFTLTGLTIAHGASFGISWVTTDVTGADNGVALDNFSISASECPSGELMLGTNPSVCQGATSGQIAYSLDGEADTYSIDYGPAANLEGFVDVADAPLTGNPITLVIPDGASLGDYTASITLSSGMSGCVSTTEMFEVHVIDCSVPFIQWIPLAEGLNTGNCVSMTDCDPATGNIICYGLEYTPSVTGTVTSYTSGFIVTCSSLGNPVTLNQSCVMTGGSSVEEDCAGEGGVLVNSSANTGSYLAMAGVPMIIHQVCLQIPSGETLEINELNPFSVSIDLTGGGFHDDFPVYTDVTVSWDQECLTLPVRWLDFRVRREDEFVAGLEWWTTEEINNSHFDIQRSNDLGRTFTTIGKVMASDNEHVIHHYSFRDEDARAGVNYYRIRQVDLDGRFDLSEVRSLSFSTSRLMVNAWPNPVASDLEIAIHTTAGLVQVGLFDITGRQVWKQVFTGEDVFERLDISTWKAGVYTLIADDGMHRYVERIVVLE